MQWGNDFSTVEAGHSSQPPHQAQQGEAEQHARAAVMPPQHTQPALAVRLQPQPASMPQRARVPPMQALIMENYMRLHQQRQEEQRGEGQARERSLHGLHQQPTAAPLPQPPLRAGPVLAEGAAGGIGGSSRAAQGVRDEQRQQQQLAASSPDRPGELASSKRQRVLPASPQQEERRQHIQRQQQQGQQQAQNGQPPPPRPPQQQQASGRHQPMSLSQAVQVSSGKWDALAAVSAALAALERSAPSMAAKQAQLDAALFAALRNRCPPACIAVVKMLLEAEASPTVLNGRGRPPLQAFLLSCESWRWTEEQTACLVQMLLAAGASATERDGQGLTPCERAVRMSGDAAVRGALRALAAGGADLLAVDGRGRTLLHHAAAHSAGSRGLEAAVELLLEAGCDPLAVDKPAWEGAGGSLALQLLDSKPGRSTSGAARLLANGMRARSAADREAAAALRAQLDSQQCCVVCMQRPRTVALLPCGHFGFCSTCAAASTACPLCRQRVAAYQTIHAA